MATPEYSQIQDAPIPEEIPGTLLVSTVVFPYDVVSVQMNKPRSLRMLADNPGDNVIVGCFFPKDPEADDAETADGLLPVGVACRVIHRMKMPNDTMQQTCKTRMPTFIAADRKQSPHEIQVKDACRLFD